MIQRRIIFIHLGGNQGEEGRLGLIIHIPDYNIIIIYYIFSISGMAGFQERSSDLSRLRN